MKTYISLSGFDTSQILSLMVKYGIEGDDRIILIRPEKETDGRGETTVQAVRDLGMEGRILIPWHSSLSHSSRCHVRLHKRIDKTTGVMKIWRILLPMSNLCRRSIILQTGNISRLSPR